jgi:hypothetical protein
MLKVYLNSPGKQVTVHRDPYCSDIQKMHKPQQRYIRISITNIHHELQKFKSKQYLFRAESAFNDMWLDIDFQDEEFEMAVASYIHRLLGQYYTRFSDSHLITHC